MPLFIFSDDASILPWRGLSAHSRETGARRDRHNEMGEPGGRRGSGPGLMADQSGKAAAPRASEPAAGDGLWPELAMMARAFIASAQRTTLFMLAGATVVVVGATAYGQIRLNAWNKPFYDALAKKDFEAFLTQLLVFAVIAAGLLSLNVAQAWLEPDAEAEAARRPRARSARPMARARPRLSPRRRWRRSASILTSACTRTRAI